MTIKIATLCQDAFKQAFITAMQNSGGIEKIDAGAFWFLSKVQSLFAHLRYYFSLPSNKQMALFVPTNGSLLVHESLPWCFDHEIVPFLWDCWPYCWDKLEFSLKLLKVRLCFVTSRQVQAELASRLPRLKCIYIPEAVNPEKFMPALPLKDRRIKLYEIGRRHEKYHKVLQQYFDGDSGYIAHRVEDFYGTMANTQIAVSFPRCDTMPEMAGKIETLTERYWESMLSGCLMLGRAPQELIDLIGYKPVVDVDWNAPEQQLRHLQNHIEEYQALVDKNLKTAQRMGLWKHRVPQILSILKEEGYTWE